MNLEPSIAITQNFVPEAHLANVMDFLKNKYDQISGFKKDITNAYELFVCKMRALHPSLLETALKEMESGQRAKKRKWDQLVKEDRDEDANAGSFSFGFGDVETEEVP